MLSTALEASHQEAEVYLFKVEKEEADLARMQIKVLVRDEQFAKDHAQAIRRAERRGRREIAAIANNYASQSKIALRIGRFSPRWVIFANAVASTVLAEDTIG